MAGAPGFEPGITGPKPASLPLGYAPKMERCRRRTILPAVTEKHDQRDDGQDADGDQRERPDDDDEDRNQRDERLRDRGDPSHVAGERRAQPRSNREVADDDHDGDEQRTPAADRAEDEQDAFDNGDPERNPRPVAPQPATGPGAAVLERRLVDHSG